MRDKPHDEAMAEEFAADPAYALQLLQSILADGDEAELQIFLRQIRLAVLPPAGRVKLGSVLAEIGREVGGVDLDIARDRSE